MRILIAEDERITRATLARHLEGWGHSVTATEDGEKAWEHFKAGGFDIVVTDWEMPLLSGLELVKRIRESAAATYVYVLMLTSRIDKSDIVSGIEAGADDFVSKPFDREELRVRLLAGERIVRLERALKQQNAELRDANERIHDGLRSAARVQQAMLPRKSIENPRVRAAWTYVPTDELGGDAIGLELIGDRYLIAYVIDVTGHGVPAALLSVTAMHALAPAGEGASLLLGPQSGDGLGPVQSPARTVAELNRRFCASDNDARFLTMVLFALDTHSGHATFARAGHPLPVLVRARSAVRLSDDGGLPLGVVDGGDYQDVALKLEPGDRFFLYSDGFLEQARPSDRAQFGEERLRSLLVSLADTPGPQLVTRSIDTLAEWAGERGFVDDMSLVVIEWAGP
jgi:sigma-B regulation protein RsbU (phosphoserine phosphatase)